MNTRPFHDTGSILHQKLVPLNELSTESQPDILTHQNLAPGDPKKKTTVCFSPDVFWPEQNLLPNKILKCFPGWQVSPSYWPSLWKNGCFRLLKFLVRSTTKATILTCQHCGGRLSLHLWRVRVFFFWGGRGNGKQVGGSCGSFLVVPTRSPQRSQEVKIRYPQAFLRGPWFQ